MCDLEKRAAEMLKADPDYVADAKRYAHVGNSLVGSLLALMTGSPRWATEQAVRDALAKMDSKTAEVRG